MLIGARSKMEIEWEEPHTAIPEARLGNEATPSPKRLDILLPADQTTGAVTTQAGYVYLHAMIEMVMRKNQPLSLVCIAPDASPTMEFLGETGKNLIGQAIVRCIRQETRDYDLVYTLSLPTITDTPVFALVCPLMNEEEATALGERLRKIMTAQAGAEDHPWLSFSVGVASISLDAPDADSLTARACAALQRARRLGGGRLWRHSDTLRAIIENESHCSEDSQSE
jgi:GGDEF domain-containing protein